MHSNVSFHAENGEMHVQTTIHMETIIPKPWLASLEF